MVFKSAATNLVRADAAIPGFTVQQGGIFRKDLDTGEIELVVPQSVRSAATGAQTLLNVLNDAFSVSADGRYAVFVTTAGLTPGDTNGKRDIYRRDMDVPLGEPGAYTLVSAIDGASDVAITYALGIQNSGSTLLANAISADGNRVVFVLNAQSNVGNDPATSTVALAPKGQVVVRDIDARRTIVMSTTLAPPHRPVPFLSLTP